MSGRITPAVRAMEQAGVAFQLLEYDYDPSADEIGIQVALGVWVLNHRELASCARTSEPVNESAGQDPYVSSPTRS